MKNKLFLLVLISIVLNSCSIEKRVYNRGYSIQWKWNPKRTAIDHKKQNKIPVLSADSIENQIGVAVFAPEVKLEQTQEFSTTSTTNFELPDKRVVTKTQDLKFHFGESQEMDLKAERLQKNNTETLKKQEEKKNGDRILYLSAAFMALASLGLIRRKRKSLLKLTRWAKANPKKTQLLIAGLQLPLLGLGVMSGYNLKEMGFVLSDSVTYISGAMMMLGFLSVPFLPSRKMITMPKTVNRHKLAYLGIIMSSLMMTTGIGNNLSEKYPQSVLTQTVEKIDKSTFSDINIEHKEQGHITEKKSAISNSRKVAGAGLCILGILAIIVLLVTTCAGICIAIFGFASGSGFGFLWGILGLLIAGLSIYGIINAAKLCKPDVPKQAS